MSLHSSDSTGFRKLGMLLLAAAFVALTPATSPGQESSCSSDDLADALVLYGIRLATDSTQIMRDTREAYGLVPVSESEVAHVLDESICRRAREAYNKAIEDQDNMAKSVIVVRVGTRFIVADPEYWNPKSEFMPHVVFDQDFNRLAIFAS